MDPSQKKPPRSPRGSRNSHVNLKKRRICTVGFYEDLTVKINPKSPHQIRLVTKSPHQIRLVYIISEFIN